VAVSAQVQVPVVTATNTTIRIMASNLSSGNNQRYEAPGLRIMKGLQPDVIAIQEFNYSGSFSEMVQQTFGPQFTYYRETGSYSIPNGVISRFPIVQSGTWVDSDTGVNDRGFAWAKIDLPGTNDLYVVSVHLKASSGADNVSRRNAQATEIKSLIQANFPANAWIIVAGDFNAQNRNEACLTTFKTFLSDARIPVDQSGNPNTNSGRDKPYDFVLPSFSLSSNQVATVLGNQSFPNGLVFDSRVYSPLPSPVQFGDSGVQGMQHMAVVKDFQVSYTVTNYVTVNPPELHLVSPGVIGWTGPGNLTYTVQSSSNLVQWVNAGTVNSATTNYTFSLPGEPSFYRVKYP